MDNFDFVSIGVLMEPDSKKLTACGIKILDPENFSIKVGPCGPLGWAQQLSDLNQYLNGIITGFKNLPTLLPLLTS